MTLSPNLIDALKFCPDASGYLLALSGGLDSCVLLDLMSHNSKPEFPLRAIHVHHGLQDDANQWVQHCEKICIEKNIPLQIVYLDLKLKKGDSVEAVARDRRYEAFSLALKSDELLLLAQHQDDQAETLLLQLLRGAGPEGLGAMPLSRPFSKGTLLRPLLNSTRQDIQDYARTQKLIWIEDPSNTDTRYDRNYLRHKVMPLLKARWPSASKTLSRSALLCSASSSNERQYARNLLTEVVSARCQTKDGHPHALIEVSELTRKTESEQAIVIREWLKQADLAVPSESQMHQLLGQMLSSAKSASPLVTWADVEVRRYRGSLYAFVKPVSFDASVISHWDLRSQLVLRHGVYSLTAVLKKGGSIDQATLENNHVMVTFRAEFSDKFSQSNELTMKGSSLKKIMQEYAIPPWERHRVPLLSQQGKLIAIAGKWVAPEYRTKDAVGYEIYVTPNND